MQEEEQGTGMYGDYSYKCLANLHRACVQNSSSENYSYIRLCWILTE